MDKKIILSAVFGVLLLSGCNTKTTTEPMINNYQVCARPVGTIAIDQVITGDCKNELKINSEYVAYKLAEELKGSNCFYVNSQVGSCSSGVTCVNVYTCSIKDTKKDEGFFSSKSSEKYFITLDMFSNEPDGMQYAIKAQSTVENATKSVLGVGKDAYANDPTTQKSVDLVVKELVNKYLNIKKQR